MICGFTASMMVWAARKTARLSFTPSTRYARLIFLSCAGTTSLTSISWGRYSLAVSRPLSRAPAMLPAPIKPIFFMPLLLLSFAKNRSTDPHDRGPLLDGDGVIVSHAHRQLTQFDVGRAESGILFA